MSEAILLSNDPAQVETVYGSGRRERLAGLVDLHPNVFTGAMLEPRRTALAPVQYIFSTWGMPALSAEEIRTAFPNLRALFYAAGSVRGFAEPFLDMGITLVSGWAANAVPVAEFTVAQMLLANKGFFPNIRTCQTYEGRQSAWKIRGPGNYGETVALLGCGMIGRKVIELLKPYELNIIAWDPFLTDTDASQLGIERVATLEEAFSRGIAVSNHLANVPETVGLLTATHFAAMREGATFINTGRGATVVENALCDVLRERPDLTALLDVTDPEPPQADSAFFELDNVIISSHIAGSLNDEVIRLADYVIDEFERYRADKALHYQVTPERFKTMA